MQTKILMKKISIGDLFEFPETNSRITKNYCNRNIGNIPVYASSKDEKSTLGLIKDNLKGIKYYEDCLSWNRNGSVGYVFIRNHRFSTNEDHRVMLIKKMYNSDLDKLYLKYEIEKKLQLKGFSFLDKCGVAKITSVFIEIPIDKKGKFDISTQKEIAKKYKKLKELKNNLKSMYEDISNTRIDLKEKYLAKEVLISDIFDIKKGDAKYTRSYLRDHKGEFPIYSSQTVNQGIIGKINSHDYDEECITWTTDGIHAGTVFYRNGKFSMTTHCGALFLKKQYIGKIDLNYILYRLSLNLKDFAISEGNKRVTANIIKKVPIEIIVNNENEFDFIKQKEAANKFLKIERIKLSIEEYLLEITNQTIDIR